MVSFVIAILSAVVLSGSFAPLNWWFLLPISVAMFLYAVTKTSKPFLISFVFAIVFNYLTLKWSGIYVGFIPVLFLVLLQSFFYLFLGFISYKRERYSRIWLILPLLLVADEVRSVLPFGGFGWNRLAFSQADAPYIGAAAFLADSVLALLGISLGIALYLLWARAQLLSVAIIVSITTLAILLPIPDLNQGSVNVLGIQGNVPRLGLDFNSRAREVFDLHVKQTKIVLNEITVKADLIVWPENSVDIDPFLNSSVGEKISDIARINSTPIIVGAVLKGSKGPENASIMWDEKGEMVSKYVKRSLTPFGEYMPIRSIAEVVSPLTNNVVDFTAGKEVVIHSTGETYIAPIICYEVIDDQSVNSIVKRSNVVIVQTNNATFADSAQSLQQLNITRIRAVENNRWILSVSTTGVSAIIDNKADVQEISNQNQAAYVFGKVLLNSKSSLANRLGDWSAFICIALAIAIYSGKRRRDV
jgi:apolipoprotein N-acyltransferase